MNRSFRNQLTSLVTAIAVLPGVGILAQAPPPAQPAAQAAPAPAAEGLTPAELEEMLGPIALYPDPLLANVLAACVYPDEVAEAAAFIGGGGQPDQIAAKPWEDPVKAVAKIPDVIKLMGQYKDWTVAMGQAYLTQAKDVMDAVQSLRMKAKESGSLKSSPEQKVVAEQQVIQIQPTDPQVIYVPTYSPAVVYAPPPPPSNNNDALVSGVIGFGVGIASGLILANNLDCDWNDGCVGYGNHGDVDVNVNNNVNVNRGGNTVNTGNINTGNVNTANTAKSGNRVGNEGNAYAPNKSKQLATAQPNQTNQFKGGATAANRAAVPGGSAASVNTANRAGAGAQPANRSGAGQAGARSGAAQPAGQPAGRGDAQPGARSGAAQPAAQPADRSGAQAGAQPGARSGAAQPAARSGAQPNAAGGAAGDRGASPSATPKKPTTPPKQPAESAFSGGRDTQADSQRGAASRQKASSGGRSAPSGGASRSAPARSGGGGGGRGR